MTHAECNIYSSYVESKVHCVGENCSVVNIRRSRKHHNTVGWTALDLRRGFMYFIQTFVPATTMPHAGTSSPSQHYFLDPDTPFGSDEIVDIYNVGKESFERTLAQLMNTYWLIGTVPYSITGNFTSADPQVFTNDVVRRHEVRVNGKETWNYLRYSCHYW